MASKPRPGGMRNPITANAPFSYVLPLAAEEPATEDEFAAYLAWIAARAELLVVDGSPPDVFAAHDRHWGGCATHVRPAGTTLVGKVANVMTGVRLASHERIVLADDDVRFGPEIAELVARLDRAEVVRPQNFFDPLPWHAVWDTGRSLLNRVTGGDWPGTLAVRKSALLGAGGYSGEVMFENYELVKTIEAFGGRHLRADDLFVRRLPPSTRHFLHQRVRQAYDELARPGRLVPFLAIAPTAAVLAGLRRWMTLARITVGSAALIVAMAEIGRRRKGGRTRFPARCSFAAPLWVAERSLTVWAALLARCRGGVLYRGHRVRAAALRPAERHRRIAGVTHRV